MKETAQSFKALSDETRLRILGLLLSGELCVCELMAILELPQSTVSRHLAYLKNSGLVSDQRRGTWMHYRLVEGDSAFHRELLEFLQKTLSGLPQVREDQKKLRRHPLRKASAACCETAC
ncbi:MAG: winged helix-turn-helix transcriptional regulator [Actinobacteria bacterium]|nr:winged helix-turn-helix transcriptional regulator [Actinomycetota bacterium]